MKNTFVWIMTLVFLINLLPVFAGDSFAEPPDSAFKACEGKEENTECFFQTPDGRTETGICINRGAGIHCVPAKYMDLSSESWDDEARDGGDFGNQHSGQTTYSYSVTINGVVFGIVEDYDFFIWENIPRYVSYERLPLRSFTNSDGQTHYYETVYVSSGNLNWFQAAHLAQAAGGYLACPTSPEENDFIFSLVSDNKFFWNFPKYTEGHGMNHYEISIGPFLGGYQPPGSPEPAGGWRWLSGEQWSYNNWAKDLGDGVIDKDPRPNDQPNDSGDGQRIMGFGEMNVPVATWGDYMDDVGTYQKSHSPGKSYGFVIEYNNKPDKE